MKVMVTAKRVVDVELNLHVEEGALSKEGIQYVINAWDENAIEAGVNLVEGHGGEVSVFSIGQEEAKDILRKALAMGANKGVLICDQAIEGSDSVGLARILNAARIKGEFDLVIMGKQSQDTDAGNVGIMSADLGGIPCVSNVLDITVLDEKNISVGRQGDFGRERIDVELPALLTVSVSINEPRLPSLRGIMQAKKKPIVEWNLEDLSVDSVLVGSRAARIELLDLSKPPQRGTGKKFEGEVSEMSSEVARLLKEEAKIL